MNPEELEQCALFDWIRTQKNIYPYAFHIANERKCSIYRGKILKRMGVKSGVSDIFISIARGGFHGLWVEMKIGKNTLTPNQKRFMDDMKYQGYETCCCYGFNEARKVIEGYLK